MEIFDVTQYKKGIPSKRIQNEIGNNLGRVFIEYPMSHINSSNSYRDIIHNYLEASFIAEELGKYATKINAEVISKDPYSPICRFEILVKDTRAFIKRLRQLSVALYNDQEDDNILLAYSEELHTYTESLDDRSFLCPDLMDGYYANLVGLAYEEIEDDQEEAGFLEREYEKYPERRFGFWKSAYSKTIGEAFYVSRECWVIPLSIDIQKLLSQCMDFSSAETYEEAILFSLENMSYLANHNGIVHFPINPLLHAKNFVVAVLREYDAKGILDNEFLTYFSSIENKIEENHGIKLYAIVPQANYLLSRSNLSVIVDDGYFRYIFFSQQIKSAEIAALYDQIATLFGFLGDYAGVTKDIKLSWVDFDDEKFENLCYDIIYHCPGFDNGTIRKMGKSRSRDGGRDIVVYTRERPGIPKKMYIFQCKFIKAESSLTAQKVGNISDTVVQYEAQGYGVMTPVVIDATLYDRIDSICSRFQIESNNWSVLEIERFIARHPNLKERHFKS